MPGGEFLTVSDSELAMALTRGEGQAMAERWLSETVVARDAARIALPPSLGHLRPGDVIRLAEDRAGARRCRLPPVERAPALTVAPLRPASVIPDDGDLIMSADPGRTREMVLRRRGFRLRWQRIGAISDA